MSGFKDMLSGDIGNVFLNVDEFAETHEIEGKEINIVMAPDQRIPIGNNGYFLGVAESLITIFADISDLPQRKESGESLNVDGREYIIDQWNEYQGMSEVVLRQTRTG